MTFVNAQNDPQAIPQGYLGMSKELRVICLCFQAIEGYTFFRTDNLYTQVFQVKSTFLFNTQQFIYFNFNGLIFMIGIHIKDNTIKI